jgi:hypothetical protein
MMRSTPSERLCGIFIKRIYFAKLINKDLSKYIFYTSNHKNFSNNYQYENFKSAKTSNTGSIDDIIGNSQKSNFGYSMENQMFNQAPKKRNRLTFLRDGMIISFHLRKV